MFKVPFGPKVHEELAGSLADLSPTVDRHLGRPTGNHGAHRIATMAPAPSALGAS